MFSKSRNRVFFYSPSSIKDSFSCKNDQSESRRVFSITGLRIEHNQSAIFFDEKGKRRTSIWLFCIITTIWKKKSREGTRAIHHIWFITIAFNKTLTLPKKSVDLMNKFHILWVKTTFLYSLMNILRMCKLSYHLHEDYQIFGFQLDRFKNELKSSHFLSWLFGY